MRIYDWMKKRSLFCFFLSLLFMPFMVYAQKTGDVRGTVIDETDQSPLIGVSVMIEGTSRGTLTDLDGNYVLTNVPANATLVFSYVGYDKKNVAVKSQPVVNVSMGTLASDLDEVVVIGYGAVRKRDLTSSISRVDESDIERTPVMSLDQALQGNAAGVLVINTSAEPGGEVSMRVRGGSSILGGNSPLIIVDGFPLDGSDLSMINPNDIVSMDVQKDASATAIYGSRGANGVIMITTKKGQTGKPKVDFQTKIHYTTPRRKMPMMDGPLYQTYSNLGRQTMGTSINTLLPDTFSTTDFQDKLLESYAIIQDHNLSISGGGEQFTYLISANLLSQPGLLMNSEFERMAIRGKFNLQLTKNLDLQFNVSSNNTKKQEVGSGDSGAMMRTLQLNPTLSTKGEFVGGLFIDEETGEVNSANTEIARSMYTQNFKKKWMNELNGALNWKIKPNLIFRTTGMYRLSQNNSYYYVPEFIYMSQANIDKNNIAKRGAETSYKWSNENTLTYMTDVAEKHHFTGMLGQSWESGPSEGFSGQARGLEDAFEWDNLQGAKLYDSMSSSKSKYNLLSFFGRLIYNYDDRYLATVTMRADGSSRFGPDSKWGYFPSASFAWNVVNEKFMKSYRMFSNLKLRLSYGLTGNDGIGNYKSWSTLEAASIVINGQQSSGYTTSAIGDKELSWEETSEANAGIDIGILKNRINLSVDVYNKQTNKLLYDYRLPNTSGYTKVSTNIGEIRNRGIEFEFSSKNLTGKFKWGTNLNVGYNNGSIEDLGGDNDLVAYQMTSTVNTPITYLLIGHPLGTFKGHKTDGVYRDWNDVYSSSSVWYSGTLEARTQPGYPKYVDRNNDGKIDEDDKVVLGHAQPDWTVGLTNTFSYRNFDLAVVFYGSFGNDVVNTNKAKIERYRGGSDNQTRYVMNGYRPMNPLTGDPGYTSNAPRAIYISSSNTAHADYAQNLTDLMLEDASFLRLKTISLGYNLPKKALSKIGFRTCKLQISGVNLLTWTEYTGMDPESSSSLGDNNTRLGVDQSSYPASKAVVFSLNLGI